MKQLDDIVKQIKQRQKKKGEVQKEEEYNGIKKFPRLCLKLFLQHSYIQDLVKQTQILAEVQPKDFANPNKLLVGSFSGVLGGVVSKASKVVAYSLDDLPEVWIACRLAEESYKTLVEMSELASNMSTENGLEMLKKTTVLFPGLTGAYIDKQKAVDFLQKPINHNKQVIKCLFKVKLDIKTCTNKPISIRTIL